MKCDLCKKEKEVLVGCPFGIDFCLECYNGLKCDWTDKNQTCSQSCSQLRSD